jgi:HSP20 family molecular chaperone IbpA
VVKTELPGMKKEDIDVSLVGGTLMARGCGDLMKVPTPAV